MLMLAAAADANAFRLGVGVLGGMNIPIAMEDAKSSTLYGIKARFSLIPNIGIEPNFMIANYGEPEIEVYDQVMKRDAGSVTMFGVDLIVGSIAGGPGLSLYGIAGIGSAKWSRDGIDDVTEMSYTAGVGFEYGIGEMIALDFRGKFLIIPHEDGSYKNGMVSAGVNYYFNLGGM